MFVKIFPQPREASFNVFLMSSQFNICGPSGIVRAGPARENPTLHVHWATQRESNSRSWKTDLAGVRHPLRPLTHHRSRHSSRCERRSGGPESSLRI